MGRLPTHYAGKYIKSRQPYTMPGDMIVEAATPGAQYPDATFLHNISLPFEIHRVIPRVTALDSAGAVYSAQPANFLLERLTRVSILDFGSNQKLTKNAQLLHTLVTGDSVRSWEWADPHTLINAQGFQISVDNLATTAIVGAPYAKSRIELTFQGFLLFIDPS